MTLPFDLLTLKVDRFVPLPLDRLCQLASKSVNLFSKYRVHEFANGQMNGRTGSFFTHRTYFYTTNTQPMCLETINEVQLKQHVLGH